MYSNIILVWKYWCESILGYCKWRKMNFENIQDRTRSCWGVNNLVIALTCIFSVKKVETHFLGCTCVRFTQPCAHRTKRDGCGALTCSELRVLFFALLRGNRKTKMWITLKQCICKQCHRRSLALANLLLYLADPKKSGPICSTKLCLTSIWINKQFAGYVQNTILLYSFIYFCSMHSMRTVCMQGTPIGPICLPVCIRELTGMGTVSHNTMWSTISNMINKTNVIPTLMLNILFSAVKWLTAWIYSGEKKVFSQPPIVQVLPLKKMREACNSHHRFTSTMRDKIRKKIPDNHIVGFLKNLFANYGGK